MTDIFLKDSFKQLERLIRAYKTPILLALAPEMQDIKYINSAFYAAHKEVKKLKSQMRFERGHTDYERQLENFEYDFLDCIGEEKKAKFVKSANEKYKARMDELFQNETHRMACVILLLEKTKDPNRADFEEELRDIRADLTNGVEDTYIPFVSCDLIKKYKEALNHTTDTLRNIVLHME